MSARRLVRGPVLAGERRAVSSPVCLVLIDDFRRVRSSEGVLAAVDIWDVGDWRPTDVRPIRNPGGGLVLPGLNFRPWPFDPDPELYRCRIAAPGRAPLLHDDPADFRADTLGVSFLAYPYDHDHPPEVTPEQITVPMLPRPGYTFPPGTRVVRGVVQRAGIGSRVANALVSVSGSTEPDGIAWTERSLSGPEGDVALALRFAGIATAAGESFHLTAVESPGHTGELDIVLTGEPPALFVVEIS